MTRLINADELIAEIERYKRKADARLKMKGRTIDDDRKDTALQNLCGNLLYFIRSLQQEKPEGIEGEVHHYANIHYLTTNTKQLNNRLKDFEEGAKVRVFIYARKEE